jgi:hypothetical protein
MFEILILIKGSNYFIIVSILFHKCLQPPPFYIARELAMNLCNYQSEYKLTNCTHALQQSKDITCTCIPIYKIITALY